MRKYLALFLFMALAISPIILFACGKNKVHSVKMERTPCMGKCPWYIVQVFEDGKVTYEGKKDVARMGYYEGTISKDAAKALMKQIQKHKVQNAQTEYTAKSADLAMMHFAFGLGKDNEEKIVRQAHFGPEYFKTIGSEIDAAIKNVAWTKAQQRNLDME